MHINCLLGGYILLMSIDLSSQMPTGIELGNEDDFTENNVLGSDEGKNIS